MNCNDCKNFEPKVIKSCSTCMYEVYAAIWEPCKMCARNTRGGVDKWEPKETNQPAAPITTYRGKQYREGEPHPEIPTGTKFRVVGAGDYFQKGEIITLIKNDGTDCPQFSNGKEEWYLCWCRLEPVKQEQRKDSDWQCGDCGHWNRENVGWCVACHDEMNHPKPPKPVKRVYTAEQIQEAKDIVYRLIAGLTSDDNSCRTMAISFLALTREFLGNGDSKNRGKRRMIAYLRPAFFENDEHTKQAVAICSDNDEWNDDIGRMVALSKLLGEPLPKWVRGE